MNLKRVWVVFEPEPNKRGRMKQNVKEDVSCPHGWDECFGPIGFRDCATSIVEQLHQYPELEFIASVVLSKLKVALGYIGVSERSHRIKQTPCPFKVNCRSPLSAATHLKEIERYLVEAEKMVLIQYGVWMSAGESPLYQLSQMLKAIGQVSEAERLIQDIQKRYRDAKVYHHL